MDTEIFAVMNFLINENLLHTVVEIIIEGIGVSSLLPFLCNFLKCHVILSETALVNEDLLHIVVKKIREGICDFISFHFPKISRYFVSD